MIVCEVNGFSYTGRSDSLRSQSFSLLANNNQARLELTEYKAIS